MTEIVEIVVFKFKTGVPFSAQKRSMLALNIVLQKYPGMLQRSFYYSEQDQRWADMVSWVDMVSAQQAAEKIMHDVDCKDIFPLIDEQSVVMSHYRLEGNYRS